MRALQLRHLIVRFLVRIGLKLTPLREAVISFCVHIDWPGGDDSRALLHVRLPLAGSSIGGLDDDAGGECSALAAERSSREDFRWCASVFALSRGERRQEFGEEIRPSTAGGKARPNLFDAGDQLVPAVHSVSLRDD